MTRPRFVPDTPTTVHLIQGGSLTLTDAEKNLYVGAPQSVDLLWTDDVRVERLRKQRISDAVPQMDCLFFSFKASPSNLWLSVQGAELHLYQDQTLFQITPSSKTQKIMLQTLDGADAVYIDDQLENPVVVRCGAGNDYVSAGGSHTTIISEAGDDTLRLTRGISHIESGAGDDSIHITSADTARVYAAEGDDIIRAGSGLNFIDAGPGNDIVTGGAGHNILSGGEGNDTLKAGSGTHVIYPGTGHDHVSRLKPFDRVYSHADATLVALTDAERREWILEKLSGLPLPAAEQILAVLMPGDSPPIAHTPVTASEAGKTGLSIEGPPEFVTRVEADLALLRSSPNGKKLLQALDAAARVGGSAVRIRAFDMPNAAYTPPPSAEQPMIRDGRPGPAAYGGLVEYNPLFSPSGSLPIIGLYHELCHAYNAVTGTAVPGQTEETEGAKRVQTPNLERQAVGLPIAMEPFDFDFDPQTPPTRTNPEAFTENGIRQELGLPPRTAYFSSKKGA